MVFVKIVKMRKNDGLFSGVFRSGYDRCRRGFASVYGILYEQKRSTARGSITKIKDRNRGQSETLENMESMIIKLIGRWNQSDDKLDRKFDALNKEINDLDNQVSEIKGSLSRVNGKQA